MKYYFDHHHKLLTMLLQHFDPPFLLFPGISLALAVPPILVGILFRSKFPKKAVPISKVTVLFLLKYERCIIREIYIYMLAAAIKCETDPLSKS